MYSAVDLHTHTTASDGVLAPRDLVAVALDRGLRALGITDHDSTEGLREAIEAARGTPLEVVPGVEIGTDVPRSEVHILGYYFDLHHRQFQETLFAMRDARVGRARRMVEKLAGLGVPIEWDRVQELAGAGAVGRPHIAQAMLEKGYVKTMPEAFALYLGRNGPAYVDRFKVTPEEAVELICRAGGVAVLAHPIIVTPGDDLGEKLPLDDLLPRLARAGLTGIEAYYLGYTPEMTADITRLADQHALITTGGSDYHGRGGYTADIGEILVPLESYTKLKALAGGRQAR